MRIAVVIPTLNELDNLPATVSRLRSALARAGRKQAHVPIVVAAFGSSDGTPETARALRCVVIEGPTLTCRAAAMNAGAAWAGDRVDVLWFVHADTHVGPRACQELLGALRQPGVVGGTFDFAWSADCGRLDQRLVMAALRLGNRLRYRVTHNFYGDQTLFVRRDAFAAVGGYPDRLLLEDIAICRALKKRGRLMIARSIVETSPRRFVDNGVLRQWLFDMLLLACDRVGIEPRTLHRRYNSMNRQRTSRVAREDAQPGGSAEDERAPRPGDQRGRPLRRPAQPALPAGAPGHQRVR